MHMRLALSPCTAPLRAGGDRVEDQFWWRSGCGHAEGHNGGRILLMLSSFTRVRLHHLVWWQRLEILGRSWPRRMWSSVNGLPASSTVVMGRAGHTV